MNKSYVISDIQYKKKPDRMLTPKEIMKSFQCALKTNKIVKMQSTKSRILQSTKSRILHIPRNLVNLITRKIKCIIKRNNNL